MSRVSKLSASSGMPKATKKPNHKSSTSSRSHQGISSGALKRGPTSINVKSLNGRTLRVSGSEYLGAIQKSASEAPDYLYLSRPNVAGPTNTRLQQFATIYERWRPLRYRYRFTSSLPTSCTGTFCMASEPDPVIPYAQGEAGNIARLRALPGSKMFQAWESAYADIPTSRDYTSLWCEDPDPSVEGSDRLDQAGTFYLACAATTSVANGTTLGMLELEYEIEFFVPRLNSSAITHASDFGFDATWWENEFGDSGGSYILDAIMMYLKRFGRPVGSIIAAVLRLYEEASTTTLMKTLSDGTLKAENAYTGGYPAGNHRVSLRLCYMGVPPVTPTIQAIVQSNVAFYEGYNTETPIQNLQSYRANNGLTYDNAYGFELSFCVSGAMRGFVDVNIGSNLGDVSIPDYTEFKYTAAGSETVQYINGNGLSVLRSKKAKTPLPLYSGRLERKVVERKEEGKGERVRDTTPPRAEEPVLKSREPLFVADPLDPAALDRLGPAVLVRTPKPSLPPSGSASLTTPRTHALQGFRS